MFSPDFIDFIKLLNQHKVEYMIVGGYAVGLHGYPRYTGDLDIWINISERYLRLSLIIILSEVWILKFKISLSGKTLL